MPMLGPHSLAGYLKKNGIHCRVCDVNVELLHAAADPLALHALVLDRGRSADSLWLSLVNAGLKAMADCIDPLFSLTAGLKLYSLLVESVKITPDDLIFPRPVSGLTDISRCLSSVEPLIRLFKESDTFCLLTESPESVVGISIAFQSQLIMGLALADAIKTARPDCTIILGGSYFSGTEYSLESLLLRWRFVDLLVRGPGEIVLETVARRLPIESIDGAVKLVDGRFIVDAQLGMYPNPDFSDARWELYASSPLKAIPFTFYTACHYGRCRFCNGDRGTCLGNAASPHIQDSLCELASLADAGGVDCVYIVDAALPPHLLHSVAETVRGRLRWAANARPLATLNDPNLLNFLAKGGCEMLRFGFESGSQRVLNMMRKGTSLQTVSGLLKNVAEAGIKNHLYILLGYPGEDSADREKTVRFLQKHRSEVFSYSVSVFQAMPGTEIYEDLCARLGLDKDQTERAGEVINTYLFPDEFSFADIRQTIDQIARLMRPTSKGNRFDYSGRVFACNKGIKEAVKPLRLLGPFSLHSQAECLRSYFTSTLTIMPTSNAKNDIGSAYIDLVNDEVILTGIDTSRIPTSVAHALQEYYITRDLDQLSRELETKYEVRAFEWNGHVEDVIQNLL